MKTLLSNLIAILVIVGVTFAGTRHWFPKTQQQVVTDTLRVDVPYKVVEIKEVKVPKTVIEYRTKIDTIREIRVEKDTVYIKVDSGFIYYYSSFLTSYIYAPKFLGLKATQEGIEFTGLYPNGRTETKVWKYTPYYQIGYSDGNVGLTELKEPQSFTHSVGAGWLYPNYPYLQYQIGYNILGIQLTGSGWLTEKPFVTVGIRHNFGQN